MPTALVWLRQDLRLADNPALYHAARASQDVLPVYCYDAQHPYAPGAASRWWLHHSLADLQQRLKKLGVQLSLQRGAGSDLIPKWVKQHGIEAVYWNEGITPVDRAHDRQLQQALAKLGVAAHCYPANLLHDPATFLNQQGQFYKVFTPFWRKCSVQVPSRALVPIPKLAQRSHLPTLALADFDFLPTQPNWAEPFHGYWQVGEAAAQQRLEQFIEERLANYAIGRDYPAQAMTSLLSPHLHFGEIGPTQIWAALAEIKTRSAGFAESLTRYRTEIGWREFCHHLLYHFPGLATRNFNAKFDAFPWVKSKKLLMAWQRGLTGYPIVDAGMRQLWHTGYMHNRVRMIVGSFLVKDLLLDWRDGAAWFWDTLVDADMANNAAGWQWVAGSGADAAPYFRVFNPRLQGEKFDPEGRYVAQWVPELAKLPAKYVHEPSSAPEAVLKAAGVTLGKNYPKPIVAHNKARDRALAAYKAL